MSDQVNLIEYIEVLLRRKKIIIVVTVLFLLLAFIYVSFVYSPMYQAKVTVVVNQNKIMLPRQEGNSMDLILGALIKQPDISMETYRSYVTSPTLLEKVIDELKLDTSNYTIGKLQKKIGYEVAKNTNSTNISVTCGNSQEAALIANTLVKHLTEYIADQTLKNKDRSLAFIEQQREKQKEALGQAMNEYKDFITRSGGVQELSVELEGKLRLLSEFQNRLIENEIDRKKTTSALGQIEKDLEQTPDKLSLNDSMSENNVGGNISSINMERNVPNQLYVAIATKRTEIRARLAEIDVQQKEIEKNIESIKKQISGLLVELTDKKMKDETITQKINAIKYNYQLLNNRYDEINLNYSLKLGETNISILSPATEPHEIVGPSKILIIAIAGIVGVVASVFIVFFLEILKSADLKTAKKADF